MKKPRLKDYGLTKEIIENHKLQVCKYEVAKSKAEEENQSHNRYLIVCISIVVILALVAYGLILANVSEPLSAFITILIIHTLGLGYLTNKNKTEIAIIPSFFTALVLSATMPMISIGVAVFLQCCDNKKATVRQEDYYSADVEKNIQAYEDATLLFNEWVKTNNKNYWINMTGYEFEKAVAELYSKQGYSAKTTSYSGDGGVDIILIKDNSKIAVQCKHHSKPVGPNDVRALMGVVASQGFDRGIFVSLNGFTQTVNTEVRKSKIAIELVDLDKILLLVQNSSANVEAQKTRLSSKHTTLAHNQTVYHKTFNKGYIKEISGNTVTVKFDNCEKKFVIPDAFNEGFLSVKPQNVIKKTESQNSKNTSFDKVDANNQTKKVCMGNCSTCKRDVCIEDSWNS